MDDVKIRQLPEKSGINLNDYFIVEDNDGTKRTKIVNLQNSMFKNMYFDTIDDMKNATLKDGDICYTLGYRKINDGGGGMYVIKYDPYSQNDNATIIHLNTSDTLRAKLIMSDFVNLAQFGAYGDGVHDDIEYINKALNTAKNIIFTGTSVYRISSPVKINSNQKINFNWCELYPINCTAIELIDEINIEISNLNINCINNSNGIHIDESTFSNININCVHIKNLNVTCSGILIDNQATNIKITNCTISGISNSGTGILIDGDSDKYNIKNILVENIDMYSMNTCVYINNHSIASDIIFNNCSFAGNKKANTCVYNINGSINNLQINNQLCKNIPAFIDISVASSGTISVSNITTINTDFIFKVASTKVKLKLKGFQKYETNSGAITVFEKMCGFLILDSGIIFDTPASTIQFNINSILDPVGTINDHNIIHGFCSIKKVNPLSNTTVLYNNEFRNTYYDWNGTLELNKISGGLEGQILYICSTTNQSVKTANNIILLDTSISLSKNTIIKLQLINGSWVQFL